MINHFITRESLNWLESILAERFGISCLLSCNDKCLFLHIESAEGMIVFDRLEDGFKQAHSDLLCTWWNAVREGWYPVLEGSLPAPGITELPSPLIEMSADNYIIHYDILGLSYWMLARVEEIGRTDLDNHERFPAISSHAFKHNYLHRPVVDEWLHILGQVIQRQWPGIELKRHIPRTVVSCDVDSPFASDGTWKQAIRRVGGDIIKRRSPKAAIRSIVGRWYAARGEELFDAHRSGTEFIMEINERAGRAVAFYLIPESTDLRHDGQPRLHETRIRKLMREFNRRGHEIGVHPGYNTYRHPEMMARSIKTLREALSDEGIDQPQIGGRQHYLRWETPTTARLLDINGMHYDSTLSYADHPGFRCGTCFEYPMFDAVEQRALQLRQRPLIVMECSVIAEHYLGLGYSEQALNLMLRYQKTCYSLGGQFGLLWHNSNFENVEDRCFYQTLVGC